MVLLGQVVVDSHGQVRLGLIVFFLLRFALLIKVKILLLLFLSLELLLSELHLPLFLDEVKCGLYLHVDPQLGLLIGPLQVSLSITCQAQSLFGLLLPVSIQFLQVLLGPLLLLRDHCLSMSHDPILIFPRPLHRQLVF